MANIHSMKPNNLTPEEAYCRWLATVNRLAKLGWWYITDSIYRAPSGTYHDLSAADLDKLDTIESNKLFLVEVQPKW